MHLIPMELRETFNSRVTIPLQWRQHQSLQAARMLQENYEGFILKVGPQQSTGFEVYLAEINSFMECAVLTTAQQLPEWAKVENREDYIKKEHQMSWKLRVYSEPKGVGLCTWSLLTLTQPMELPTYPLPPTIPRSHHCRICCIIKPSEVPAHYANVLAELVPKYFNQSAFHMVLGAVSKTTQLLKLKWDHIFYTGNGTVTCIITVAARHLTPVTLKLAGKSPVIIGPNFNSPNTCGGDSLSGLLLVAKRIFWGKTSNAGQICVAPDYILLVTGNKGAGNVNGTENGSMNGHKTKEESEEGFKQASRESFLSDQPGPLSDSSPSYPKIINFTHFSCLSSLFSRSRGRIVCDGESNERTCRLEPTVLFDVVEDGSFMQGENFGPVLPVLEVVTVEDAIEFVRSEEGRWRASLCIVDDGEFKQKGLLADWMLFRCGSICSDELLEHANLHWRMASVG
ncbi:hypothetical protein D9758_012452 [Tetrapyrgos nigripes]|uniref:Aldehyde dehydrogenase domain-containing protein n=1 Tax=Tetrapyrgos nigripes TaxID=182062 RepID=A0A8H5FVM3_9AGAR|nr:hypothetical protein D9758_012452 [Tetrapyrgos nigripes]